jgi:iron(III) transport system ATP-binding protein
MSGIKLEQIAKLYGSTVAVENVDLSVEAGEFVTLLGPSGSGKTTTMRMIAGLERPTSGVVAIGGRTVSGPTTFVPTYKRRIGMVFQSYAVWPHRTVYGNVAFPLEQQGIDRSERKRRVDRILDLVELGSLSERYPSQLSGGQQQRIALARALVAEPEVILFDEPLSNLDAQLRETMRRLLRDMHRHFRVTAVYVTHDQLEAMTLSDRVYIMNRGRLVQSGSPEELFERPTNLFVAEFIGSANVLPVTAVNEKDKMACIAGLHQLHVVIASKSGKAVVVRPHRIRFVERGAETENTLTGRVASTTYLGDRIRYTVDLSGSVSIAVEPLAGGKRYAIGDEVMVYLPPDACLVL